MSGFEHASVSSDLTYDDGPPALLFGPMGTARSATADMMRDAGLRLADVDRLDGAAARIGRQLALGLIWVEAVDEELPTDLIDALADHAARGPGRVVVATASSQIDPVVSALGESSAQILIDPTQIERAGALALALAEGELPAQVSDFGRDSATRLRQISDEMGRIAATLARLSSDDAGEPGIAMLRPSGTDLPTSVDGDTVRSIIRARRLRARFLSEELFADPAWDMMLDLLQAEIAQHRVPVSSLCIAAAVPATTALRWIKTMIDAGLFVRRADPHDGRLVFVELAPDTSAALHGYFGEVGKVAVI